MLFLVCVAIPLTDALIHMVCTWLKVSDPEPHFSKPSQQLGKIYYLVIVIQQNLQESSCPAGLMLL